MSTDITIEASPPRARITFRGFVARDLASLARSIAIAIGPGTFVDASIESALRSARTRWPRIGFDNEPELFIFSTAVSLARSADPPTDEDELNTSACAVAHHGLGWPTQTIAARLGLTRQQVATYLRLADTHLLVAAEADRETSLPVRIHEAVELVVVQLPDWAEIDRNYARASQRHRTVRIAVSVVALLAILALASQLLARNDRADLAAPSSSESGVTEDNPAATDAAPVAAPLLQSTELRVAEPELIASDGAGGFVGVRSPSPLGDRVEFTQSEDGTDWLPLGRTTFGSSPTIDRFERSGDSYVAWIRDHGPAHETVLGSFAISDDLRRWNVLDLVLGDDEDEPRGLTYAPAIIDVAVSGSTVLAIVRNNVDVDYAALNMSEGYTCGRTISATDVSVNMCNGRSFDVLDFAGLRRLPNRHRLFVGTIGEPFREVPPPFGNDSTPRLAAVGGSFVLTDESGVAFATSRDGKVWQSATRDRPPFQVLGAAADPNGTTVGLGSDQAGALVLFRYENGAASTVPLEAIIAQQPGDLRARVALGERQWVVYAHDPTGLGWLLTSPDGLRWTSTEVLGPRLTGHRNPALIVGASHVVVQWRTDDGIYSMQVLPLDVAQ